METQKTNSCYVCDMDAMTKKYGVPNVVKDEKHTCGLEEVKTPPRVEFEWGSYDAVSPLRSKEK